MGEGDRDLSEYLIDLASSKPNAPEFRKALLADEVSWNEQFVTNLYNIIQFSLNPPKTVVKGAVTGDHLHNEELSKEDKAKLFPALSLPNKDFIPLGQSGKLPLAFSDDDEGEKERLDDRKREGSKSPERESGWNRNQPQSHDRAAAATAYRSDSRDRRRYWEADNPKPTGNHSRSPSRDLSQMRRENSRSPSRDGIKREEVYSKDGRRYNRAGQEPRKRIDDQAILYKVYSGKVARIQDYGCFVQLDGIRKRVDGFVHISQLKKMRVNAVTDVVQRNQAVWVKVISAVGNRISLSMKDVDQESGEDLNPVAQIPLKSADETRSNPMRQSYSHGPPSKSESNYAEENSFSRGIKRIASPELWELKQLQQAGTLNWEEHPDYHEEAGGISVNTETEEEFDIELNEGAPAFLQGQTRFLSNLSPIKVVKNPDGTLLRAAQSQTLSAKERREQRELQRQQQLDSIPRDINRTWEDPLAESRHIAQELRGLTHFSTDEPEWKDAVHGKVARFGKVSSQSIKEQRASLPIFIFRDKLIEAIQSHQILVVVGETGSGKTTQMPQYFAEAGLSAAGKIGCTQPRRVAAMSVAKRVAEEVGCRMGDEVGYSVRFEDCTSPETRIKFMTDGMLLRECLVDPMLSSYAVIMLDEAHERTISTDVLFGLIKVACKKRPELRLIVTSATLDADKFSNYFNHCPIFTIPGRNYKVDVLYSRDPETDYLEATLVTVMQIHLEEPQGDVLVFLTGQEEIDTACQILHDRMKALGPLVPELMILPVYSALPSEMQTRIFEPAPPGARKCIIATNIAETSLTIDGIYYVVDPGFCKQNCYNPKLGMDSLMVVPISQAQADQRKGRAGRTGPGKCFRLYTEAAFFNEMHKTTIPEIQRANLGNTVLTLKAMGINDLVNFDFMDPPPLQTLVTAMEQLHALGALDDEGFLTPIGRKMAEFPLEPTLSKILIASVETRCSEEVLTIVAMLSVENVFYRPKEKQTQADERKAKFYQPEGDHLTLLAVFEAWKASKFSKPWCFENFIQSRSMERALDIRKQLLAIMDRYKLDVVSCKQNYMKVCKAITSGYFRNASKKDPQEGYRTMVDNQVVYVHPGSSLHQKGVDWVIYHELVMTTKEYMREVMAIDPRWLVELAPKFYKPSDPKILGKRKKAEKIQPLFDKYRDPNEWRLSRRMRR